MSAMENAITALVVITAIALGIYAAHLATQEDRMRSDDCKAACVPRVSREIDEKCHCQTTEGWIRL